MRRTCIGLVALAVMVTGCGGGGSSVPSIFAGLWAGTWSGGGENGTAQATVAQSGNFTGSGHNNTTGLDFSMQGKMQNDGDVSGTVTYQGFAPVGMSGNVALGGGGTTLSGTIVIDGTATTFNLTLQ